MDVICTERYIVLHIKCYTLHNSQLLNKPKSRAQPCHLCSAGFQPGDKMREWEKPIPQDGIGENPWIPRF